MWIEITMEYGRDVVYSRGSRWRMQFYDRKTERHYGGGGDTAWEALAWLLSDYKRRGLEGGGPRIAFNSHATPEFPDGAPREGFSPLTPRGANSNTLASVAVEASPHCAAMDESQQVDPTRVPPPSLSRRSGIADTDPAVTPRSPDVKNWGDGWARTNPALVSDETKRKLGLLPSRNDQPSSSEVDAPMGSDGDQRAIHQLVHVAVAQAADRSSSTEDKIAARRAKVRARLKQRKGDGT